MSNPTPAEPPTPVQPAQPAPSATAINAGRLKHLEMIQAVITRMANNSFLIKGWSISLMGAILAFAAKDGVFAMVLVAYIPVVGFWLLDGYFLWQERLYHKLWDKKRAEPQCDETDFSLDASKFDRSWLGAVFSPTLMPFHGGLLLILIVVTNIIR